ncbi:glycosyltransferase involved in cell wall biosynthesis [Paraburkholderia sp. GAS333]|uniref:glycosyltransferase family 2 protein n=1 Tax=Paraburkholderia sp. GAS333 TaxID=3156279 RepID=UPI003D1DDD82
MVNQINLMADEGDDDKLINAIAANERLGAMLRVRQMPTSKALNEVLGDLLITGVRSPWALLSLPAKLIKAALLHCRTTPPKSLGGEGFDKVTAAYDRGGFGAVDQLLSSRPISPVLHANAYTALGRHLLATDSAAASEAASRAYRSDPKAYRLKWLAFVLYKSGNSIDAAAVLDLLSLDIPFSESEVRLANQLRIDARLACQREAKKKIGHPEERAKSARALANSNSERDDTDRPVADAAELTHEKVPVVPTVSIIMSVFNAAEHLDASIASVRYQTYQDFELIIVDDASTDASREIIAAHANLDKRIRAVYLEYHTPGGSGIPRNIGMDISRGTYIGFIDGGDCFAKTAIEKLIATADEHQADIVLGDGRTFIEDARDFEALDTLPTGEVFSATNYPDVFHTSALVCQKLYRRNFLSDNRIAFPDGDYGHEDNAWHWFVLASHGRIVKINDIISYRHVSCADQRTGVADYKLVSIFFQLNTIGSFLINSVAFSKDQSIVDAFYDYCYRSRSVWQRQERGDVKAILGKRLAQIVEKGWKTLPAKKIPADFPHLIKELSGGYPQHDLTIVIPTFNCEAFIEKAALSVLHLPGVTTNVLVMDDGSDDRTADICRKIEETYANFHFFQQKNSGAGPARNALIPLCTGTYTFFLDSDDVVDGVQLARAVTDAKAKDHDLYFMKYQIEFYEKHRVGGMFGQDEVVWNGFPAAKDIEECRGLALALVNYPWNRIIKTQLLHDAALCFGAGSFSEDVLFNWESVLSATHIGYGNEVVVTHRKFEQRPQLTNVKDRRRLRAFDVLEFAHSRVVRHPNSAVLLDTWNEAMKKRMHWLKGLTPDECLQEFEVRRVKLMDLLVGSCNERMHSI